MSLISIESELRDYSYYLFCCKPWDFGEGVHFVLL